MKPKLSKSKRNNQKRNKLVKQGVIKKNKVTKKFTNGLSITKQTNIIANNSEESDQGEDLLEMVDEDDMNFLKNAITSHSYNIYNKVKLPNSDGLKVKRRKLNNNNDDERLENAYENQLDDDNDNKKVKNLLPIKTKQGIIQRQILEEIVESENEDNNIEEEKNDNEIDENEESFLFETDLEVSGPISESELLAKRNEILNKLKIHIGTLSSGLLENPEEKVMNLRTLLTMLDEETSEVYISVKKILLVSLLEIFKDILPSYEIKNINSDGVKLKKDTLKIKKYEENLLLYYKKFLQKLEKYAYTLLKKKGDSRKRSQDEIQIGTLAIKSMCDLLSTHPYFNFSQNLAQAIIPFLNNRDKNIREGVKESIKTIFKEDKKEEITLKILRVINNYLKNHSNVYPEMLEVLLILNLKDVNLDKEKQQDVKQKKLMAHKSRILQLSKKEKKRQKKLKEVEKELLETKAEENRQIKQKNLTEITKIVFNIYFRILKKSNNTKILSVCLEGLSKFAHCINLEFYVDIVNVLDNLLKEDWLGYREQLHCIQTVFAILSGQGDALNLDPLRFYNSLYKGLLTINASSRANDSVEILIKTLNEALIKRRKKITVKRQLGFLKRLSQLCLQLTHDGSLASLGIIRNILQLNRSVDVLLDTDPIVGEGKYNPEINDPEYSNASTTALYELIYLTRHYHSIVNKFARNIASGAPSTGDGSLPGEYLKSTPQQLYEEFNMSEMVFNPPVPPPRKEQPKKSKRESYFADQSFKNECKEILQRPLKRKLFWID